MAPLDPPVSRSLVAYTPITPPKGFGSKSAVIKDNELLHLTLTILSERGGKDTLFCTRTGSLTFEETHIKPFFSQLNSIRDHVELNRSKI